MSSTLVRHLSRQTSTGRYIPELDGMRFLAIGLVFWQHVQADVLQRYSGLGAPKWDLLSSYVKNMRVGVELFFLISGFILGLPFASNYLRGGSRVVLKQYYLRRLTRLEPPYFLAMLISFALLVFYEKASATELLPHLLAGFGYVHNVTYKTFNPVNGVTWSLEVEVQFYILAPLLAKMFKIRPIWLRRTLFCMIPIAAFAARHLLERRLSITVPPTLLTEFPYFMMGLLLADIYVADQAVDLPAAAKGSAAWDAVGLAAWVALAATFLTSSPGKTLSTAALLFTFCFATFRGRILRAGLSATPIRLIGGMCYSVYLLHFRGLDLLSALWPHASLTGRVSLDVLLATLLFSVPVLLVSAAFFVLIEKPCMDREWPRKLGRFFFTSAVANPPE